MTVLDKENYFAVSVRSKDDGYTVYDSYFSTKEKAEALAFLCGGKVVPVEVWADEDSNHYLIENITKILVDVPSKHEVLAKLTEAEKKALGF